MKAIDMFAGMKVGFTDPENGELYTGVLVDAKVIDDEGLMSTIVLLDYLEDKVLAPIQFLLGVL